MTFRLQHFALCCALSACLTGCGEDDDGQSNIVAPSTGAASVQQALELSVLPKLDQSSSLLGTDDDFNGIRDDIDTYIDNLGDSSEQKSALRLQARALQSILAHSNAVQPADISILQPLADALSQSVFCEVQVYDTDQDRGERLESLTFNTRDRFLVYLEYNEAAQFLSPRLSRPASCD